MYQCLFLRLDKYALGCDSPEFGVFNHWTPCLSGSPNLWELSLVPAWVPLQSGITSHSEVGIHGHMEIGDNLKPC